MTDRLRLTILGCGSSPGVPRITGDWGACDPSNPKNRRRRAAALIERIAEDGGKTTVVIDTGPDFREQMLMANVQHIDAVVYTHAHADHIHGIDDVRSYVIERLREAFRYCFETPEGSSYPPIVKAHLIDHDKPVEIDGRGGIIRLEPLPQSHGDIISLGFRVENLAYCSDVSAFPTETAARLYGLDWLVIDALQYRTHPSHFSLGEALDWIERIKPKHAALTHMHVPLDYETVLRQTPENVEPAYDGMVIEMPLPTSGSQ
jgi:phosphoribosyl 1,2-cyclic phosphate phosphodiesterase